MHRRVFATLLIIAFSTVAIPVFAQTLTGSGNVVVSATVPDLNGSPAQVIISSMASVVMPNMSANVTITNEGTEDYEYFYEWCVISNPGDACSSGHNAYYASASKLILMGQSWNTTLTATVLSPGVYYFKTTVYFGSNASTASYQFTTTSSSGTGGGNSVGGGGSGGGGGGAITTTVTSLVITPHVSIATAPIVRGDFTGHGKVDISDFSVLLSYWGKPPPASKPWINLSKKGTIGMVDFSILLYLMGKHG